VSIGETVSRLLADLRRDEGEALHAYSDDPADAPVLANLKGYLTIGVGVLIDQRRGGGITAEESELLLRHRIDRCIVGLDRALPWWRHLLSDDRQRALLNMAYQLGVDGLLEFHHATAALEAGDYAAAASHFLDSKWARQTPARAERVVNLIRG
jgi:lysozyme